MKNYFILLLCILNLLFSNSAHSGITPITEMARPLPNENERMESIKKLYDKLPDIQNKKVMDEFIEQRLKEAPKANMTQEEARSPRAVSIVDPSQIAEKSQKTLSAYQKIYNESMKKAGTPDEQINKDLALQGTFYKIKEKKAEIKPFIPDFPYVKVKLSDEKEILAPAEEHFPYVLTTIRIEPTGLLRVSEEFIFVSNNESFPYGFFRILPKFNYSRTGKPRRMDVTLKSVTINNKEYPYKITEIGNYLYIEPQHKLEFPTGIYTYRFNYLIDRAVWYYKDFDELNWNITAKTLMNVVGSANAVVILPNEKKFLAQNAIVTTKTDIDPERVTISYLSPTSLAFADTNALDVSEDVHLFLTLEKGTLLAPSMSKKYWWFVQDYGSDVIILLTLIALLLSYRISYKQIRHNQDKTNVRLKKSPAIYRYLNQNIFDSHSFCAELLNLCTKNILSLQPQNQTAALIKKTDNLSKLSSYEHKFVDLLFPNNETVLSATSETSLRLKRAFDYLKKKTKMQFQVIILKLNAVYTLCGLCMLLTGMICSSMISVNPLHTFLVIFLSNILLFAYMFTCNISFSKRYLNIATKTIMIIFILTTIGGLSIYTSKTYAVIMTLCNLSIIKYYRLFARRNGLLRNKIKETEELKSYLQKNPEFTATARDFNTKIPYIYTFSLENKYAMTEEFKLIQHFLAFIPQDKE